MTMLSSVQKATMLAWLTKCQADYSELVNYSLGPGQTPVHSPAGVTARHMSVTLRWPLATVHSGDVTVHSDRPE